MVNDEWILRLRKHMWGSIGDTGRCMFHMDYNHSEYCTLLPDIGCGFRGEEETLEFYPHRTFSRCKYDIMTREG